MQNAAGRANGKPENRSDGGRKLGQSDVPCISSYPDNFLGLRKTNNPVKTEARSFLRVLGSCFFHSNPKSSIPTDNSDVPIPTFVAAHINEERSEDVNPGEFVTKSDMEKILETKFKEFQTSLLNSMKDLMREEKEKGNKDIRHQPEVIERNSHQKAISSGSGIERRLSYMGPMYHNSYKSPHTMNPGSAKFTVSEINEAIGECSSSYVLGRGGFPSVYKGRLKDGTLIAVKREMKVRGEFRSGAQMFAQVEHINLVRLYGYLELDNERVVVVEYVPNGTLGMHLHDPDRDVLDFATRLDIAIDVAHAISYLHMYMDHPIIYGYIASSKILLTENLSAKVANFGFADTDSGSTHESTAIKGTPGYLDPEYARTGQQTEKSDVYSFGVLLVELVSGRHPIELTREEERITTVWAMKKFIDGDEILTLDPRLDRSAAISLAVEKIYELALYQCLAPSGQIRPNMRSCAGILMGIRKDFREFSTLDSNSFSSNSQKSVSVGEE